MNDAVQLMGSEFEELSDPKYIIYNLYLDPNDLVNIPIFWGFENLKKYHYGKQ
jgi:hypothetical protein